VKGPSGVASSNVPVANTTTITAMMTPAAVGSRRGTCAHLIIS
jgi:hypothetical protein